MGLDEGLTYSELLAVHRRQLEIVRDEALCAHQLLSNFRTSGDIAENAVRKLLQDKLPKRFRVTHGYILYCEAQDVEPQVSPQIDILITDTSVGDHLFWLDRSSGVEIVPAESVAGVFEVKAKLTVDACRNALQHLRRTFELLRRIDRSQGYIPGGISVGPRGRAGKSSAPLFGIVSLSHKKSDVSRIDRLLAENAGPRGPLVPDIIFTFDGFARHLVARKDGELCAFFDFSKTNSADSEGAESRPWEYGDLFEDSDGLAKFAHSLAYTTEYFSRTSAKPVPFYDYYLNQAFLKSTKELP